MAGQTQYFLEVLDESFQLFNNDLEIPINILLTMVSRPGGYEVAEKLSTDLPKNHPVQVLATYHAGCSALLRGDMAIAFNRFETFRNAVIAQKHVFPISSDKNMNIMFRQALLIERPEIVAQIESAEESSFVSYSPELKFDAPPHLMNDTQTPVFISCCNGIYFRNFARNLAQSVVRYCPEAILHFHVAEPDTETSAIIGELRKLHPDFHLNYSVESDSPFSGSVYFACNRFLLAARFLDLYQSGITVLDVDGELTSRYASLTTAIGSSDVACFSSGKPEPASVYQAAVVHFAHSAPSLRFAHLLRRFILMKLELPPGISWMLDQAAMFSSLHFLSTVAPDFHFVDLTKTAGITLTTIFTPFEDPEGKLELMRQGTSSEV